jgi:uncharacterized protein YecE (DUF72 family)
VVERSAVNRLVVGSNPTAGASASRPNGVDQSTRSCYCLKASVLSFVTSPLSKRILIGTASWSDPGFIERWYPPKLPAVERLPWYAQFFGMVEINSTFYAVPETALVRRWCDATPDSFVFDVKVHRLLSHHATPVKTLPRAVQRFARADGKGKVIRDGKIERAMLDEMIRLIEPLRDAEKFGAFLLQLSPAFSPRKHTLGELEEVVGQLGPFGIAVELRNRDWVEGEQLARTLKFFREQKAALVLVDAPAETHFTIMPSDLNEITLPKLAYVRLHGREASAYLRGKTVAERFYYDYSDDEIGDLAQRAKKLARQAERVHIVFNNNALDFAPHAAARMRAALGQLSKMPPRQVELFR